jgi:Mn2+/Fe2+ NRAMP family transporter
MKVVYWISLVLVVLTLAPSLLYWMLYLSTGEAIARARATNMFRWCIVVVLATFNIWIFGRVFGAIRDIWFSAPPPPPPPPLT